METVEQVKDAGTKLYREKSYLQAAAKYTEAIKLDSSCATYYNNRFVSSFNIRELSTIA